MEVDPELVVSRTPGRPWRRGALAPWSAGQTSEYFARIVQALADTVGFRTDVAFERLPAKARTALLHGYDGQVHVRYRTGTGGIGRTTPPTRASSHGCSAATPRPSPTSAASGSRGSCERFRARRAAAPGSSR